MGKWGINPLTDGAVGIGSAGELVSELEFVSAGECSFELSVDAVNCKVAGAGMGRRGLSRKKYISLLDNSILKFLHHYYLHCGISPCICSCCQ